MKDFACGCRQNESGINVRLCPEAERLSAAMIEIPRNVNHLMHPATLAWIAHFDDDLSVEGITVPLTDKERRALNELAQMQELSPERVMIQALRLYQLVKVGGAKVTLPDTGLEFNGARKKGGTV